jgi:molybdopterin converting factor subunit 1
MRVTVKMFASLKEASGAPVSEFEVPMGTTVSQLWRSVVEQHPRLGPLSHTVAFAVNGKYTRADVPVAEGDEVAFLPPVSGG